MGGAAVGKSALTIRFVMKKFVTEVRNGLFSFPNHAPRVADLTAKKIQSNLLQLRQKQRKFRSIPIDQSFSQLLNTVMALTSFNFPRQTPSNGHFF